MSGDIAEVLPPEEIQEGVLVGTVEVLIDHPGYQGPERRMDHVLWRQQVDRRLDAGAIKMRSLHTAVEENTTLTKQVQSDTSELVSLLRSFQGAFKVFNMIGKLAKPLAYIAMAATSVWGLVAMIKGGDVPNVPHGPK